MPREPKPLTLLGLEIILDHNENLSSAAQRSVDRFRQVLSRGPNVDAEKQLTYWKNVRSALRWSSGIAKQRANKLINGGRHGVQ